MPIIDAIFRLDVKKQIFLLELTALLHNLGKMSSSFITRYASDKPDGFEYEFDRVVDPATVVKVHKAEGAIRSRLGLDWIQSLCDEPVFGSLASAARDIKTRVTGNPSELSGIRRRIKIAREAAQAAGTVPDPELISIANKLAAAAALAYLLQTRTPAAFELLDSISQDGRQSSFLRDTEVGLLNATARMGKIILLMADHYHGWAQGRRRDESLEFWLGTSSILERYLITAHGDISGGEKGEKGEPQPSARTSSASAFGYEPLGRVLDPAYLDSRRNNWLGSVMRDSQVYLQALDKASDEGSSVAERLKWRKEMLQARERLLSETESHLSDALGETRRCYNDVTLWDYVSSIAALFKASAAKAAIEDHFVETDELQWRFLSIRYNGLEYLTRAHHISDLLARQRILQDSLDAVKTLIEVDYPLGNEVYRDENGSVLIVPHLDDAEPGDVLKLSLGAGIDSLTLRHELLRRFSGETGALDAELVPSVGLSAETSGKGLRITESKNWTCPASFPSPTAVERIWSDERKRGEICSVCEARPQGYGAPDPDWERHWQAKHTPGESPVQCKVCKAQDRSICFVCLERRDERSKEWATRESEFKKTIWVDEVAGNDGRLALIAGRFGLDGWLNGQLIPTMMKGASFARIRRCWETTRRFWRDVGKELPALAGGYSGPRLVIVPDAHLNLGAYHTYELDLGGRYLSVVYAPKTVAYEPQNGQREPTGCLITVENLEYAEKRLAIADLREHLIGRTVRITEPSSHLTSREGRDTVNISDARPLADDLLYAPAITILSEASLYVALAPADKAMDIAEHIKQKFDCEMARVRDRLPLHLGLIFAPRRTPVRALLEAAQRMLKMPDLWEPREVVSMSPTHSPTGCRSLIFTNGIKWDMPVMMGDYDGRNGTLDRWYGHIFTRRPAGVDEDFTRFLDADDPNDPAPWKSADSLGAGEKVMVRPSLFDFEFLDTTGRRLEIAYNELGRRRSLPNRPFPLERLADFRLLWGSLTQGERPLGKTQLQNFEGLLTERITAWHHANLTKAFDDDTFKAFALDTLHRMDKGWWRSLDEIQRNSLEGAAQDGTLLDLLDLMMHILKQPRDE